jgi:L-ascorbate metabolism protein UlaG (beta-lactamase superfamily)
VRTSPQLAVPFSAAAAVFAALAFTIALGAADDRIPASGGDILVRPLAHSSVQIEFGGRVIQVDPWSRANLSTAKPADLILVTDADAGAHHLDVKAIEQVRKTGAPVVIPESGKAKVPDGTVLGNGQHRDVAGFSIDVIASYDVTPGDPFHAKGVANGYIVTLGGKRVFLAGVTECVPEIKALRNIDVAFVPMNLPNGRMTPTAVADCLRTIKPKIAYPYHFDQGYIGRLSGRGGQPAAAATDTVRTLADAVKNDGIEVRLGEWYPTPTGQ